MKKLAIGIFGTFIAFALMAPTGGFPSRPTFQAVNISQSFTGTARLQTVKNSTAGVANTSQIAIQNDLAATNHELDIGYTSSTFSGAFLVGGPTGESGFIGTPANLPLCIGTNGKCVLSLSGTTQGVSIPVPASGNTLTLNQGASGYALNLTATAGNAAFLCIVGNAGVCGTSSLDIIATSGGTKTIANNQSGSNTNITTVGGGVVQINGVTVAASAGSAQMTLSSTPALPVCNGCGASPTIVRNSAGNYTVNHNNGRISVAACNLQSAASTSNINIANNNSGNFVIATDTAGVPTDPNVGASCVFF